MTRTLLVNADDCGLHPGVTDAVLACVDAGLVRSTSLMPPCPDAGRAARLLRDRPDVAVGVHLTLVCDEVRDRWGPVSPPDRVPSLLDDDGAPFTPATVPALLARARLDDVEREFRAQLQLVLDAGLAPTHLDWHCLADGGRPDLRDLTLDLAAEHHLAVRMWGPEGTGLLRARGLPTVDQPFLDTFALASGADRFAGLLRALGPGLTEWAVHPGPDSAEARAQDPGGWAVRAGDLAFLTSAAARDAVREEGVVLTDWREQRARWYG